ACRHGAKSSKLLLLLIAELLLVSATSLQAEAISLHARTAPFLVRAIYKYGGKVSPDEIEGPYSPMSAIMTDFYDIALGLSTVFLLVLLIWSIALRRKVREQTEQIRLQMKREAILEKNYHELFENANDVVYTHDLNGNLTSL